MGRPIRSTSDPLLLGQPPADLVNRHFSRKAVFLRFKRGLLAYCKHMENKISERIEKARLQVLTAVDLLHLKEGDDDLTDKLDAVLLNLVDVLEGIKKSL